MSKKKEPSAEREQSIRFSVHEHIDVSGYQLADMLKEWIVARLQPEIKAVERRKSWGFMARIEPNDVTDRGVQVAICDNDPPYHVDSVEYVLIPPKLMKVLEAAKIMEEEMHNDPVDEGW